MPKTVRETKTLKEAAAWIEERRRETSGVTDVLRGKTKVDEARERFGKPFAHEAGSTWKPNEVPFLTRWLSGQIKEKA